MVLSVEELLSMRPAAPARLPNSVWNKLVELGIAKLPLKPNERTCEHGESQRVLSSSVSSNESIEVEDIIVPSSSSSTSQDDSLNKSN